MALVPKNKNNQISEIQKEGPIPFLVYDSNTRSNSKNFFIYK